MIRIEHFIKAQPVLFISFILAAATMFVIPPDSEYIGYCNFGVLMELFALMTATAGLKAAGLFERLTDLLLKKAGNVRRLSQIFILLCFFSSMAVTNDVALITFVPLTILAFSGHADDRSRILTIVLETAAANLGSMMTPVGNPQNLYIYDKYSLSAGEFFMTMLPAGAVSLVLLLLLSLLLPKTGFGGADTMKHHALRKKLIIIYSILFAVCLLAVFKVMPYWVCALLAVLTALFTDKRLLLKPDYALLVTFICFFVFVGNISRIGAVNGFVSSVLGGRELIVSALLSQVISNVPAAVMLSGFTSNAAALLVGVNLGGLGTPIASMASLISLQNYRHTKDAHTGRYIAVFSAVNFGLLAVLLVICIFVFPCA